MKKRILGFLFLLMLLGCGVEIPPAVMPTPIPQFCPTNAPLPTGSEELLRVTFQRDGQTWLWREETGAAEAITLPAASPPIVPAEAVEWVGSEDGQVAHLLRLNPFTHEVWVSDWDLAMSLTQRPIFSLFWVPGRCQQPLAIWVKSFPAR